MITDQAYIRCTESSERVDREMVYRYTASTGQREGLSLPFRDNSVAYIHCYAHMLIQMICMTRRIKHRQRTVTACYKLQ